MPLYEYQCESCEHRFEVIQKFSDAPIDACPKCGSAVRKLFSSPAIQFKGSGWYITDYAKKSGASDGNAKGEGGSGKAGEPSAASTSDSASKADARTGGESKSSSDASTVPSTPAPKAS